MSHLLSLPLKEVTGGVEDDTDGNICVSFLSPIKLETHKNAVVLVVKSAAWWVKEFPDGWPSILPGHCRVQIWMMLQMGNLAFYFANFFRHFNS